MTINARAPRVDEAFGRTGTGPLSDLVIADFSRVLAGPYCTMLLADMGATVIKVESPGGDDTRSWLPPVRNAQSTYYLSINRNKHSIVLDFNDSEDLQLAQQIAARADLMIENFKPGTLKRFGLDYASTAATNPQVVYASISGFGPHEGAALPGYDLLAQAISGMMSLTGSADAEPYRTGVAMFDVMTGLHAAIGLLAALHHRTVSGQGQHVELNLLASALSGLVNQTAAYVIGGVVHTGWAMRIRASIPMSPCRQNRAKSSLPWVTTGNSPGCPSHLMRPSLPRILGSQLLHSAM